MNLRHIEYACRAYELRSFAKAADALFVSRQALSKGIKALEGELGVVLFLRGESGVVPSAAALELYPHMKSLVEGSNRLRESALSHMRSEKRLLKVAVSDGTVETLPQDFFDALEASDSGLVIQVEKHFYARSLTHMEQGEADAAIIPYSRYLREGPLHERVLGVGVEAIPLTREAMHLVFRESSVRFSQDEGPSEFALRMGRIAKAKDREREFLRAFERLELYSVGAAPLGDIGFSSLMREHGVSCEVHEEFSEFHLAVNRVLQGRGAISVPHHALTRLHAPGMVILDIPESLVEWEVSFVFPSSLRLRFPQLIAALEERAHHL